MLPYSALLIWNLSTAATSPASATVSIEQMASTDLARADATLRATERTLSKSDGSGLLHETAPGASPDGVAADEWPFSQLHIGVLDLTGVRGSDGTRYRPSLDRYARAQERYWIARSANGLPGYASRVGPPLGSGGDLYYDDNLWVGLAAVQHWLQNRDDASLKRARAIYDLVRAAWDNDVRHPSPGGLRWTQAPGNGDRNTVSNMPAAQLALRLHAATGNSRYLDDALRYYRWTNATLQRSDGLYHDHLKLDGSIDKRVFAYNQGVPVAVNVLLYKATRDARYLAEAQRIAAASDRYFLAARRIESEPVPFAAIYFKNLLLLESVTGGTRYRDAMRAYAAWMWRRSRDPHTGLFRRMNGKHRGAIELIDQGAMIQIFAVLAWHPDDHARLY